MGGWMWGGTDERESIATLHRAIEIGCNFFDTAQGYGPLTNEELLGRDEGRAQHSEASRQRMGNRDSVLIDAERGRTVAIIPILSRGSADSR